jgi:ABC-type multidrug transport system fused ATPase/permease subunit/GT2 family glycosyltransferase
LAGVGSLFSADALAGVTAAGKFLAVGGEKLYVRGVTYGTFAPDDDGRLFPPEGQVDDDFRVMARNGVNAVRIYTSPPRWLLDRAADHSLRVMVGLSWEDHVAFLESRKTANGIVERVRTQAAENASHPAVLCVSVGNEIPAPIVRWYGPRPVEAFLERLCRAAKAEDPDALVTYVNYPSTEYLDLPFLDLACFNVFLESRQTFANYVARLHNVVGDRPLLLTEIGLDSIRNGEQAQARHIGLHVRTAFEAGCAGAFVFSWTDDWHRGGLRVEDWGFGLTNAARRPKKSLAELRYAFAETPLSLTREWPRASVIVCSHNGAATIADCLAGIEGLDYPSFEIVVVDDGSTDGTAAIAEKFDVTLIRTENHGLSSARNTGIDAANGDIVAFLDDDCVPDRHWLRYLVPALMDEDYVGVGGPNIPPADSGTLARAIASGPGGPMHVLLADNVAEHIPGCNMAFWKDALEAIGGFDPRFRIAGDDVDICWRLQQRGWTLGFCAAAMVWHRRRPTVRSYLRQQQGYGRAEALLERKWPERYNRGGHLAWAGRVYAGASHPAKRHRNRIRYGSGGSNLFQSVYDHGPSTSGLLPLMPEWYLLIAVLVVVAVYEAVHEPLLFPVHVLGTPVSLVLLALSIAALAVQATRAGTASVRASSISQRGGFGLTALTAVMYALQPLARLVGRLQLGLTPWRRRGTLGAGVVWPRTILSWSTTWRSIPVRLANIESTLHPNCMSVVRGGECDRWDIHVRLGSLAGARLRLTTEEHGQGRQLLRARVWPRPSRGVSVLVAFLIAMYALAVHQGDGLSALLLACAAIVLALRATTECAAAMGAIANVVAAHELTGLDGLPERNATEEVAGESPRALTLAAADGRSRAGAEALRVESGLGHDVEQPRDRLARYRPGANGGGVSSPPAHVARGSAWHFFRDFPLVLRFVRPYCRRALASVAMIGVAPIRLALRLRRRESAWRFFRDFPRVLPYAKPYKGLVSGSVGLICAGVAIGLLAPWPLAILIDTVLDRKPLPSLLGPLGGLDTYTLLAIAVVGGLVVTGLQHSFHVLENYVNTKLEQRMALDLRSDMFQHAQRLSLGFHDQRQTGMLMYQINQQASAVGEVTVMLPQLAQNFLMLVGMFLIAVKIDMELALLSLTVVPFIYYSAGYYAKRIEPRLYQVRGLEGQSLSIVYEAMAMLRVIVAFGREAHEYKRFREQGETAVDARVKLTVRQTMFSLGVSMITAVGTALVLAFGAYHVLQKQLTVGELMVVMGYIAAIYQPLEQISATMSTLQQQFINLRGALDLLDTKPEIVEAPDAVAIDRARGQVRFEQVTFGYERRFETLRDVSFEARPGQTVAIVGPTGAGKSTLVSLIPRFYDPGRGRVLLDGLEVRRLTLASLRAQISVVLQEALLFSGSIRENIRYGRLDSDNDDVIAAARAANAHDFIEQLPQGYDTELGERGAQLSGGERQRIAVARAFLKDAPILILDEPTSAVDSKTEAVILDALDRLMEGRTTFLIAHRLATIRSADWIVVLHAGEIVEQGQHDVLLERGGLYRELHDAQSLSAAPQAAPADDPKRDLSPELVLVSPELTEEAATNGDRVVRLLDRTQGEVAR